jgi:V/A-type H+-transporting ATPase subunit E
MGHEDLIAALRAQGADKAAEMRREAEEEAARLADEAKALLDSLDDVDQKLLRAEKKRLADAIIAEAEVAARRLLAASRSQLADRLSALAKNCLLSLRDRQYEIIFSRLAEETPSENWSQVKVNPEDAALAGKYFPTTPVLEDNKIIGGFELVSEDRQLSITNTLEKRLERCWPVLLPKMVGQLEQECRER